MATLTPDEQDILDYTTSINDIKPSDNYFLIVSQLLKVNRRSINVKNHQIYNPADQSSRIKLIKSFEDSYVSPTTENNIYYGVVLDFNTVDDHIEILIDVPPKTKIRLGHPDDLSEIELNDDEFSSLTFLIKDQSDASLKTPIIGGICLVEINSDERYYIGMHSKTAIISVKGGTKPLQPTAAGPFTTNSAQPRSNIPLAPKSTVLSENDRLTSYPVIKGRIGSVYGGRIHPTDKIPKNHQGIDIKRPDPAQRNMPEILSNNSGKVAFAGVMAGYGNTVIVESGARFFLHAHLSSMNVKTGDQVSVGQLLGFMGSTGSKSTGPHLHFEIRKTLSADFSGTEDPAIFLKNGQEIIPFLKNQNQPTPNVATSANKNQSGSSSSVPTTRPKILLLDFDSDLSTNFSLGNKRGNSKIKIREDIYSSLLEVKKYLNLYNLPLCFNYLNANLSNKSLNPLEKVGLQIHLNKYIGLNPSLNLEDDEYYIGPDYNNKIGSMFKLKIYGNLKKLQNLTNIKYKYIFKEIDIYDIRETYLITAPKIKKIFKPLIDITEIFENSGFLQVEPEKKFFLKSDYESSNWFKFYSPLKIINGYSSKELLETVYYKKNESIWLEKDTFWDGKQFI